MDDHSLLRRDDIRAALVTRADDTELSRIFDASVHNVVVAAAADRSDRVSGNARGLVLILEDRFIHNPARSALDLLPPPEPSTTNRCTGTSTITPAMPETNRLARTKERLGQ